MENAQEISDRLNRTVKLAVDSGEVASLEEAQKLFEQYRLRLYLGEDVSGSATHQAVVLTIVNAARRCFLGGVEVIGCPDDELLVPWKDQARLRGAVTDLGGAHVDKATMDDYPSIVVGDVDRRMISGEFAIRATFDGWTGGVTPVADDRRLSESTQFTPSGVLAGALATSEAFQYVRGSNARAGLRDVGISLWEPENSLDWFERGNTGPALAFLPARLWIIGLGHLGQAFLWTLGFLPYRDPTDVLLVVQDTDLLVRANESTSPLTDTSLIGKMKTRAIADWCEQRGFRVRIIERLFSDDLRINNGEPRVAICGVDNAAARRALGSANFDYVIEAGLGKGGEEYLAYQIHTFPGARQAQDLWIESLPISDETATVAPAYAKLESEGMDKCGLTQLGERSVGACFVGLLTSTLIISEVLRTLAAGPCYDVIDGSLRDPSQLVVVRKTINNLVPNLGYTDVA